MFPQPDDPPACRTKGTFDGGVALSVAAKFGEPICAVAARLATVLRAPMPKAPVHEDRNAFTSKNEIGMPSHRLVPAPAGNSGGAEDACQLQLRVFVAARADRGHHLAALLLAEHVGHGGTLSDPATVVMPPRSEKSVRSLSESLHAHTIGCATGERATISRTPVAARGCCRSCPPVPNRRTVRAGDRPGCRPTPRHGSRVGGTLRAPGRLQWLAEAWVGGPFAAPRARRSTRERERGQHMRTRRIGGRVRRARGQHPKVSATRNWYDAPLTRPKVGRSLRERRPNRR